MTQQVQVAVIGGGIMGVASLYELAEQGWHDCILLEKAELTSGSTWHAAGQIAHAVGSRLAGWINKTSIETYKKVQAETGQNIGWHEVGGFRVAYSDDEVDWLKSIMGVGKLLDLPMELVGPEAIQAGNPFYNTQGIKAAVQTFADGHIDPSGVTMALAQAARARGARIQRHNQVLQVERQADGWRLITQQGDIIAEHVVIAAGSYANQVGEWFGLTIPSVSCLHHYLVTDTVPEFVARGQELPVMRDNSFGGYIRQEQQSGLIGIYEGHVCPTVWTEGAPWEAENPLFDADYDSIGDFLMVALERMPILENLGIKRVVRGAITHTPDGGMLLGPSGVPNVWLACGSSIGLAWGGGAAKLLAQWMIEGKTAQNTRSMDPRRYGDFSDQRFIIERTKDEFMRRHDTPLPGKQLQALRPLKRHILYDRLAAKGAQFAEIAGWERPRWFATSANQHDSFGWQRQPWQQAVAAECAAIRDAAGVIDLCAFAQMRVTGKHAAELLDRLSANAVPQQIGRMTLCHLLTPQGRFETEMTITKLGHDDYFIGSAIARQGPDYAWLCSHIAADEEVKVENLSNEWGMLALSGPASRKILAQLTHVSLANEEFDWLSGQQLQLAGEDCIALRVAFTGELGWEIHAPLDSIGRIYDALFTTGNELGLKDIGSLAFNACRMEKAYPASAELTTDVGMVEADLLRFFKPDKGEFIGREVTLARQKKLASSDPEQNWRLVYGHIHDTQIDAQGGEPVLLDGQAIGQITSSALGHRSHMNLFFAYIKAPADRLDVSIQILNQCYPATLLLAPAWDADNQRPKQ